MAKPSLDEIANAMYDMVKEYDGKKNLKAGDLTKAMVAKYGEPDCSKDECRRAIRILMDSGRCVYAYLGGSFIQLPKEDPGQG